jgi:hypothetical protein
MRGRVASLLLSVAASGGCGGENNEGTQKDDVIDVGDQVRCLTPLDEYFTYFETGTSYTDGVSISSLVYAYPSTLTEGLSDNLHVTGTVSTYSGVGISFGACVDASEFSGIEFDVWGDVGPTSRMTVYASTRKNSPQPPATETGTCIPVDPLEPYRSCMDSYTTLDISPSVTHASIPFSSFRGGLPSARIDASGLLAFFLALDWNDGQAAYPLDLYLGDAKFSP